MRDMQTKVERLEKELGHLKKKEKEYKQLERQLQQSQKMEAIATLAGGVAHDFNNILQAIMGTAQLLLMEKDEKNPDYEDLKQIETAAQKGSKLTRQFLALGKNMQGKLAPRDLNRLLKEVKGLLGRTLPKMIDIELQLEEELKLISIDGDQIEQMVINLCVNARDAMPEGGKLTLKTKNVPLNGNHKVKAMPDIGEYVLLTVSDTGVGMTKQEMEHIFEPFYTTKKTDKGTGLGLSMVYAILKNHGGIIDYTSRKGEGTTFELYFPVADIKGNNTKVKQNVSGGEHLKGKETILLVDDEDSILDIGKEMLGRFGYKIVIAKTGEEALKKYTESAIDLVILDIGMPGMGGLKCLENLFSIDRHSRVIITSGYSEDQRVDEALESGARAFVAKPYHLMNMMRMIRDILDN